VLVVAVVAAAVLLRDDDAPLKVTSKPSVTEPSVSSQSSVTESSVTSSTGSVPGPPFEGPARAVAVSEDHQIVVIDTTTGAVERTLAVPQQIKDGSAVGLDLTPDGQTVYAGVGGKMYRIPIEGGTAVDIGAGSDPTESPDGKLLAYISGSVPTIVVRDLASGDERAWAAGADLLLGVINHIAWAPDSQRIAFDHLYNGLFTYVLDTAQPGTLETASTKIPPKNNNDPIYSPMFLADGRVAALATCANGIACMEVFDPATNERTELARADGEVKDAVVDPTGRYALFFDGSTIDTVGTLSVTSDHGVPQPLPGRYRGHFGPIDW
jgi:hypothetical protein